jgi:hypothetical protein
MGNHLTGVPPAHVVSSCLHVEHGRSELGCVLFLLERSEEQVLYMESLYWVVGSMMSVGYGDVYGYH